MALSVQRDRQGPDWPLGNIVVAAPSTPVNIMSLVDPGNVDAPETAPSSAASGTATGNEYTVRAQQIIFQAFKASGGLAANTGNIYIVRKGAAGGSGNRTDQGSIVAVLTPGQTFILASAAFSRNVFDPYRYSIDADNANDACQVTLVIQ